MSAAGVFRTQRMPAPLTGRAFIAVDGERSWLGHTDDFALRRYDGDGDGLASVLRIVGAWPPITPADARARLDEIVADAVGRGSMDPLLRRVYEEFASERLPTLSSVLVGHDGNLWVGSFVLSPREGCDWVVLSESGALLGTVTASPRFTVYEVGAGYLLGVYRDELDVPYVRRHPLVSPE